MSDVATDEAALEAERAQLLQELGQLRAERDPLQARLDAIDGRRWDVFSRLREMTPKTPYRVIGEAYGVSEPAVIQTLGKKRPQAAADR